MPSPEPGAALTPALRTTLIGVARQSIAHGLETGRPLAVEPSAFPSELRAERACFVTLHRHGQLRGCIGHLQANQALVVDVAENAFAAAFRDARFAPLTAAEWPAVDIELSLLGTPEPLSFDDEADLIRQLEPGRDGLILEENGRRGTFLPSVWEDLADPTDFLAHLKRKAGLASDYWSERIAVYRYRTEQFGEAAHG